MTFPMRFTAMTALGLLASGCVGLGTNIEGDFTCRAPKGDCAPSHVIDERATAGLANAAPAGLEAARVRAGIASDDLARTAERTMRIVFPAHVDAAGTLHDEAVAWAVVENPQWAAALRRREGSDTPPLMRQLRKQLKAAQSAVSTPAAAPDAAEPGNLLADTAAETASSVVSDGASPFSQASPLALPSTAAEAVAGAKAPAVEGFDMSSPLHVRTPRPDFSQGALEFPAIEAIEAAKQKKAKASPSAAGSAGTPAQPHDGEKQ